jgi:hypothetical protein
MKLRVPFTNHTRSDAAAVRGSTRVRRSRKLLVALVGLIVVGVTTGAWAYFTSTGSGAGNASTSTLQGVTVAAVSGSPNSPLYPGGTGDVILNIANSNAFAVKLVDVSGNGTISADSAHAGCTTTGVSFTNQTALSITIPANSTSFAADLPGAASMSAASLNACQGATFTIQVKATVHSS